MKSIKFKEINKFSYYLYFIPLSILGVFMIFYNPLDLGVRENKIYGLLPLALAFLIMNDFFLPRNIVEYNSEVIRIKINTAVKKNLNVKEIQSFSATENELIINIIDNKEFRFNLSNIESSSKKELVKKLTQIVNK